MNPRNLQFNIRQACFPNDRHLVQRILLVDAVGCVGLRPLSDEIIEMKRLFVYPEQRGNGIGLQLALAAIQHVSRLG